jgi:hypothetical protein
VDLKDNNVSSNHTRKINFFDTGELIGEPHEFSLDISVARHRVAWAERCSGFDFAILHALISYGYAKGKRSRIVYFLFSHTRSVLAALRELLEYLFT